jgi:hypothetical protein
MSALVPQNTPTPNSYSSAETPITNPIDTDITKIQGILQANGDKDFVKRIINPKDYGDIDIGNGQHGTHLMAWDDSDGKNVVYPLIVNTGGKLKKLDAESAYKYAMKNNEYLQFDTPQEAEWFSTNYKKVWGNQDNR